MEDLAVPPRNTGAESAIVDQSIADLNSKLPDVVDKSLGFGFLEGQVKRQLIKLRKPVPFCSHLTTESSFDCVENTSSSENCMRLNQMIQLTSPDGDYGAESSYSSCSKMSRDQRAVCFFFKRTIAKRSIPVPKFRDLIPVRKRKSYKEDGRWIVERLGNQICTDEFYGGMANISFVWDHSANMNASKLISSVQAALASGDVKKELVRVCETNQVNCRAVVKGFALPGSITGSLTSTIGVMNLIESLNHLPIDCTVPVGKSTIPIQNASDFPRTLQVEMQIRDLKLRDTLLELLQRIHDSGGKDSGLWQFIEHLREEIEDAQFNDRTLLIRLKELANTVVQTLVHHGKLVELYERYGEYRLHTENCDTKGVTSSATETLVGVTGGVAIPFVRLYQRKLFERSAKWTPPEHYETTSIAYTQSFSGYYDRVKFQLIFNDENHLMAWRAQMDHLLENRRARRLS